MRPQWAPVGGYPGYEVQPDTGVCRSVERVVQTATGCRRYRAVELRQSGPGKTVTLYLGGRRKSFTPDALLALAVTE